MLLAKGIGLFFLTCFAVSAFGSATKHCGENFQKIASRERAKSFPWHAALFARKPTKLDLRSQQIRDLAEALVQQNLKVIVDDGSEISVEKAVIKVLGVKKIGSHPHYDEVSIRVKIGESGIERETVVEARTNGRAMFLHETFELNQEQKFFPKISFINDSGVVEIADQTTAILSSLPQKVRLSRVMTEEEARIWKENEVSKLVSHGVGSFDRGRKISPRTSFALNYFKFGDWGYEPVLVDIPLEVLEDLNRNKKLLINTYNSVLDKYQGMPSTAFSPFGLEVEVVVLDNSGQTMIQPFMAKPAFVPETEYMPVKLKSRYKGIEAPKGLSKEETNAWWRAKARKLFEQEQKRQK